MSEGDPESLRNVFDELAKVELGRRNLGPSLEQGTKGHSDEALAPGPRQMRFELVGRGLQAWVQLARALEVDPEQALRRVDDERMATARRNSRQAKHTPLR